MISIKQIGKNNDISSIHPEFAHRLIKHVDILSKMTTRYGSELFYADKNYFVDHILPEFPNDLY